MYFNIQTSNTSLQLQLKHIRTIVQVLTSNLHRREKIQSRPFFSSAFVMAGAAEARKPLKSRMLRYSGSIKSGISAGILRSTSFCGTDSPMIAIQRLATFTPSLRKTCCTPPESFLSRNTTARLPCYSDAPSEDQSQA
jgi:hypothetical protein